jgi:hypothetical protein
MSFLSQRVLPHPRSSRLASRTGTQKPGRTPIPSRTGRFASLADLQEVKSMLAEHHGMDPPVEAGRLRGRAGAAAWGSAPGDGGAFRLGPRERTREGGCPRLFRGDRQAHRTSGHRLFARLDGFLESKAVALPRPLWTVLPPKWGTKSGRTLLSSRRREGL